MTRPHLRQLGIPTNYPPLPTSWDGDPTKWGPWQRPARTSLEYTTPWACPQCAIPTGAWTARGYTKTTTGARSRFYATRCGWCGYTDVYEYATDELWELDATDYGPEGSRITTPALF